MGNSRFSMVRAVRNAYLFTGRQAAYLLRLGAMPLALQLVTVLGLYHYRPDASVIESFLWALPANVFFAWFMFAETRLLLLGERLDALPTDEGALRDRDRAMTLSIMILLLFNMAMTAVIACMKWAVVSGSLEQSAAASVGIAFLIGALVWGLRFAVLHILAAVGYPLRAFLSRVRGMEFSLRLIGMGFLCSLPVYIALEMVLRVFLGPSAAEQLGVLTAVSVPVGIFVSVLLNAAATYALQDLLGGREDAA